MFPATSQRVPDHTRPEINEKILERTKENIAKHLNDPGHIDERLEELEHEWDIERVLETNASSLVLIGAALAALVSMWWLLIPLFVSGFLLQHALQGWCPPIELFRRRGVRTMREIDQEIMALKIIRGDMQGVSGLDRKPINLEKLLKAVDL